MVGESGGNLLAHHDRNWYLVSGLIILPLTTISIHFLPCCVPWGEGRRWWLLGCSIQAPLDTSWVWGNGMHQPEVGEPGGREVRVFLSHLLSSLALLPRTEFTTIAPLKQILLQGSRLCLERTSFILFLSRSEGGNSIQLWEVSCFTIHCFVSLNWLVPLQMFPHETRVSWIIPLFHLLNLDAMVKLGTKMSIQT